MITIEDAYRLARRIRSIEIVSLTDMNGRPLNKVMEQSVRLAIEEFREQILRVVDDEIEV